MTPRSAASSNSGAGTAPTDSKKYLFDRHDFTKRQAEEAAYTEEQLALAREQGFALGKAEGLKEAKQQQEERLSELLQKVSTSFENLTASEERREMEKCADAARLATKVAHKLLPQFAQKYALPEIERVILQTFEARRDEPRIAVTVPTVHLDALKSRIDAVAIEKSYAGKVILVADDHLPVTDCRVEWADGGAERLYERLFSQIENEFTKAISSMNTKLQENKDPQQE